jgi:pimeloyl-ACP methyl ester carboxylesterase
MTDTFVAAYDKLLDRWPPGTESSDLTSVYGRTRVHACGPRDAPPLLLIPGGGGATSLVWTALTVRLARACRVYAVDLLGDAGRSQTGGRPLRTAADVGAWLDSVLDGLGVESVRVCGHSYGGWLALTHALHAPGRVTALTLLDPTSCFTQLSPRYLLHAAPVLARPTPERVQSFLRWEIAGLPVDQQWLHLATLACQLPRPRIVRPRRPAPGDLARLTTPIQILLAEHSRCHNPDKVAAVARRSLPAATIDRLPHTSHHSLPTGGAAELGRRLPQFPPP